MDLGRAVSPSPQDHTQCFALSSQLPSPAWCSRQPQFRMMQLCCLCIFNLLWRKPLWRCLRSFWLLLLWDDSFGLGFLLFQLPSSAKELSTFPGVKDGGWLFCSQIWKVADFLQTWAFNQVPGEAYLPTQPQTGTLSCRLMICSYMIGSKGKWSSLQSCESAWVVGICLPTSRSNSGCLQGTSHLLIERPCSPNMSHLSCVGKHECSWVAKGCWTWGCCEQLAKRQPMLPQLHLHHMEVSLGMCLAKPEERRWNLFPIHNRKRVKPAGISCTLSVMTNYSRCWCIC